MTEDATLTDYLAETESSGTESTTDGSEERAEDEGSDVQAAEPATSTYAWGPYECAACGEPVERVWRADEGLVCAGCKSW